MPKIIKPGVEPSSTPPWWVNIACHCNHCGCDFVTVPEDAPPVFNGPQGRSGPAQVLCPMEFCRRWVELPKQRQGLYREDVLGTRNNPIKSFLPDAMRRTSGLLAPSYQVGDDVGTPYLPPGEDTVVAHGASFGAPLGGHPLVADERLKCPPHVESATGHFDPAGYNPADCAGCGCPIGEHHWEEATDGG